MEPTNQTKSKILIVDDVASSRLLARAILAHFNYQIYEASDGEEALQYLREQEFDVVLLDINMPGMSGLEVTQKIRKELGLGLIPIILNTILSSPDDITRGLEAGAND